MSLDNIKKYSFPVGEVLKRMAEEQAKDLIDLPIEIELIENYLEKFKKEAIQHLRNELTPQQRLDNELYFNSINYLEDELERKKSELERILKYPNPIDRLLSNDNESSFVFAMEFNNNTIEEVERLLNEFIVTTDYSLIIKLKELMRYSSPHKLLNEELCIRYNSVMRNVYETISQKKYQDITDPDERWLFEGYELDY